MLSAYPACFFREDSSYSVIFPDLDNLATCGKTLDEALAMALDCLAGYLYSSERDGSTHPAPSALSDVDLEDVAKQLDLTPGPDDFVNVVTVNVAEYAKTHFERPVKKTLAIPAWLNNAALAQNINFSQTLQEALKHRLGLN